MITRSESRSAGTGADGAPFGTIPGGENVAGEELGEERRLRRSPARVTMLFRLKELRRPADAGGDPFRKRGGAGSCGSPH